MIDIYNKIKEGEIFIYDREFISFSDTPKPDKLYIYPGSFNPLHAGHLAIFNSLQCWFELTLKPKGKSYIEYSDWINRIKQFDKIGPVMLTDCTFFHEKLNKIRVYTDKDISFILGFDTATRLISDNSDVQDYDCTFIVFPRKDKRFEDLVNPPTNFIKGPDLDSSVLYFSSTDIRSHIDHISLPPSYPTMLSD